MAPATESELAALYIMANEAVYIRIILEEMGYKQPPTPMQTDNAMADAVQLDCPLVRQRDVVITFAAGVKF